MADPIFEGAGKNVGVEVWRVNKFALEQVPKKLHGTFFSGDCYLVLQTYKRGNSPKLHWNVFYWQGKDSTTDELGTGKIHRIQAV